jgi:hypothetical protein
VAAAHTYRNIKFKHIVPVSVCVLARPGGSQQLVARGPPARGSVPISCMGWGQGSLARAEAFKSVTLPNHVRRLGQKQDAEPLPFLLTVRPSMWPKDLSV